MLAAVCVGPALAQNSKWGPHLDLEAKPGTKRSLGEGDLFIPVLQNADTLLFASLRMRMDDQGSSEGNYGLGLRHMLDGGWNLGAYGYFDRRRTPNDNYFSQVTLGVEALSQDWDLRANYYAPVGVRAHTLGSTAGGDTTAAVSGATVQIITTGSSRTEERSLGGFDAEIGWRVPVFEAGADKQFRIFGGAYHFSETGLPDVSGPRVRAELTFDSVPYLWEGSRLSLGAEWQHDDPRGSQGFLTARLRIPLQVYGKPPSKLTPMERRMADPVVRDIDIVAQTHTSSTPSTIETATQISGGNALVVVDNGANLPTAVTNAGANATILVSGSLTTNALINMVAGQTLMGSGTLTVQSASGKTATLTTSSGSISRTGGSSAIASSAANVTITGLTIAHSNAGTSDTITSTGTNLTLSNNTISSSSSGSDTRAFQQTGGSATLSGNTITASGSGGNLAYALSIIGGATATISNNTLGASGGGTNRYTNLTNATINAGSTGNTANSGNCGTNNGGSGFVGYTNAADCNAF